MKLAICDDEKIIRDLVAECAHEISNDLEIEFYENTNGIIEPYFCADILILDIHMEGIDGMEAARILRRNGSKAIIIFLTALEEYVFSAFDVGAFQYIVKPFEKKKLKEIITDAIEQVENKNRIEQLLRDSKNKISDKSFIIKNGKNTTRVNKSEILYAEVFNRKVIIHMKDGVTIEYYGKLKELETIVGKDFFRVHRAYVINLAYVKNYDAKNVNVAGEELPVARGKYPELVKAYLSYHTKRLCL